jgi:endonuclease IV
MNIGCSLTYDTLEYIQESWKLSNPLQIAQIYTHSTKPPQQIVPSIQIEKLKEKLKRIYIHSSFDVVIHQFYAKHRFKPQYDLCIQHNLAGIIVHIQNIPIEEAARGFKKIMASEFVSPVQPNQKYPTIFLEHIPGEYASPELLNRLLLRVRELVPNYPIGLCIDTCHIFASGYDIWKNIFEKSHL